MGQSRSREWLDYALLALWIGAVIAFVCWPHHISDALHRVLPPNLRCDLTNEAGSWGLFVWIAGYSAGAQKRRHLLSTTLWSLLAVAGVYLVVALLPRFPQPFNIASGMLGWLTGRISGFAVMDAFWLQAWRAMTDRRRDIISRIFWPVGAVACAAWVVFWLSGLNQRWLDRDYQVAATATCFVIGLVSTWLCRKAPAGAPEAAVIA